MIQVVILITFICTSVSPFVYVINQTGKNEKATIEYKREKSTLR